MTIHFKKHNAIFLMGPTAAGKTELAIELVQRIPAEIISVDSAMIYRGMDIGTGKPSKEELRKAPHHLIDIRDPKDAYSAASFCDDALKSMQDIQSRGKIPILVGGTMLYFRALEQGLSPLPSANEEVREKLLKQAQAIGWEKMHERLQALDPIAAKRIHPNDPQRIQRALEVYEITGKAISSFYLSLQMHPESKTQDIQTLDIQEHDIQQYHIHKFALVPRDRKKLHDRIAARFHKMLEQGLVEEVQALYHRGDLHLNMPSMRAVGYRQVWQYLAQEKNLSFELMVEQAIAATRQLAKRQLTWLRNSKNIMPLALTQNQPPNPLTPLNTIHYLEIENSYLDSLQSMIHCLL